MVNPKSKIQNPKSEKVVEFLSGSVEETQAIGERIGRLLRPGDVVALFGELGTGKTTLIQGLARGLGRDPEAVKSPTFVLMREYPPGPPFTSAGAGGEVPLVHIDGYRLADARAVSWLDLDLVFSPRKITVIEWAERFAGALPEDRLEVRLSHVSANRRRLVLVPSGPRAAEMVTRLQQQSKIQNPKSKISSVEEHHATARD
ncbi:MAG: tRNA (adenosine(37)-N6)-threonylcarbamoyltransferase complex ATPase subunit type 1 TsaE [Candidatus Omnitrophica bacterium]|nr:tRNA (adenosine(37)-N6)-threonylcarbamoyltransferase complex ATPase subunit type 1 TsaE [Candidatus Omnitrophota bacterium]